MTPKPVNPQKQRKGLSRIWHAGTFSVAGLRAGWDETAFRQEALASVFLLPAAFWLGRGWVEIALLVAPSLDGTTKALAFEPPPDPAQMQTRRPSSRSPAGASRPSGCAAAAPATLMPPVRGRDVVHSFA